MNYVIGTIVALLVLGGLVWLVRDNKNQQHPPEGNPRGGSQTRPPGKEFPGDKSGN